MTEHKMTYQERVYNYTTALFDSYSGNALVYRREFEESAISAIAAQAEAIREAICYFIPDDQPHIEADRYLLEHGYIEPKIEDDGVR